MKYPWPLRSSHHWVGLTENTIAIKDLGVLFVTFNTGGWEVVIVCRAPHLPIQLHQEAQPKLSL
jgi:hypothetical protein